MVTFDSPVLRCEKCGEIVLRDTRWQDCARAHGCQFERCPYADEFLETDEPATTGDRNSQQSADATPGSKRS